MYKAWKIFFIFLQNKKVLKFQHFRDSTKILDFHSRAVEHVFFGILRLPYTKLPLKKSLFRAFIHLNTPLGYFAQGQTRHAGLRKVKRAAPDCARSNAPRRTAPSRPQLQAVGAARHLRALYAGVFVRAAAPYRQHRIGRPRRPPLQQRLAQSIVPQICPQ